MFYFLLGLTSSIKVKILKKITIDNVQMPGPHSNLNICTDDWEVQCGKIIQISNFK